MAEIRGTGRKFRALLDLIDDDTALELRRLFKDTFLDYTDRAMKIQNRLRLRVVERETRLSRQIRPTGTGIQALRSYPPKIWL